MINFKGEVGTYEKKNRTQHNTTQHNTTKQNKKGDFLEDTIWATHVVRTASRDKILPRALSWTSVTVAIPTPRRRIRRANWMLLLQ